ncbi:MAG: hypothetical protein FJ148_21940 [Deltaproteobacteria bacterium]|nr:hypothetical protein [Deltaproteobacteria bacterium]
MEGFYLSLVLALVAVVMLRDARVLGVGQRVQRLDARCGDLAYPLFLVHHPITLVVVALLPFRLPGRSAWEPAIAVAPSFLAAWLLHRLVEVPIACWRDRVRPTARAATPAGLEAVQRPASNERPLTRRAL